MRRTTRLCLFEGQRVRADRRLRRLASLWLARDWGIGIRGQEVVHVFVWFLFGMTIAVELQVKTSINFLALEE